MAPRALWKAQLQLAKISLPVRLFSAQQDKNVHFHLLHAKDHQRVHERMRRASDGEIIEHQETRTGYATDTGEVVLLEKKERDALAPKPSRDIRVLHCGPRTLLPMAAFSRPYWLGPDGGADVTDSYFALADALGDRMAVCEWVLRGKHHFGAITEQDGYLMLVELHSADEWVDTDALELPNNGKLEERELALAAQLIQGLDAPFDHTQFHDEYRERVQDLIDRKAHGKRVPRAKPHAETERTGSLLDALSTSLRGLKRAGADGETRSAAPHAKHESRSRKARGDKSASTHRPRGAKSGSMKRARGSKSAAAGRKASSRRRQEQQHA